MIALLKKTLLGIALVIPAFYLITCKSGQPQRTAFQEIPQRQSVDDWATLLAAAPRLDSFEILNTGAVQVPLSGMLNTKKLPADHGLEEKLWVEVYAFLFHHQEKGWFLIDTGLDSSFQDKGNINGLLAGHFIKAMRQAPGQNIGAQLRKKNHHLQGIFLTHLHGDHSAGLPEIEAGLPLYVGKFEKYFNLPLLYRSNHLSRADTLIELDWAKGAALPPFDSVLDIFGDGSFFALYTPGHSKSHLSYLLLTDEGPILLTGDASHTRYGFEQGIEPGWVQDAEKAAQSLGQLRNFAGRHPDIRVIFGHQQ